VSKALTAFENHFKALRKVLGNEGTHEFWPDFEPQYDEHEYAWTTLRGLGEVLLLNCGGCDGPSDVRHKRCAECVEKRSRIAKEAYQKATGHKKDKWDALFLCRIHTE